MRIYGAGLAGLLAAHMLRRHKPEIYEVQPSLPNNHEALLRFRTPAVSIATGIPFQKVTVDKSIRYKGRTIHQPDIQLNNLYSYKVTGEFHPRSIGDTRSVERYIAPGNFIEQMSRSCSITYGAGLTRDYIHAVPNGEPTPIISTIPMPVLMDIVGWPKPEFRFKTIWSVWCEVDSPRMDLYQTIYYPDPEQPYYRASITGNRLILEYSENPKAYLYDIRVVADDFGIGSAMFKEPQIKEQKYGKLAPVEDKERKRFMLAMTDKHRIYSVGRFATWRQILMDDVVKDVERVEEWITNRDEYAERLAPR